MLLFVTHLWQYFFIFLFTISCLLFVKHQSKFVRVSFCFACCLNAVLRYSVAVFTAKLISAKYDAFVTIFGEQGDTGQRVLRESVTYSRPFADEQTDVFFIEAVHLGQLRHVLLEFTSYGSG